VDHDFFLPLYEHSSPFNFTHETVSAGTCMSAVLALAVLAMLTGSKSYAAVAQFG
jgi:hypothetical protein